MTYVNQAHKTGKTKQNSTRIRHKPARLIGWRVDRFLCVNGVEVQ